VRNNFVLIYELLDEVRGAFPLRTAPGRARACAACSSGLCEVWHELQLTQHVFTRLSQVIDYGYPQNCSVEVLKMYITQEGNRRAVQERAGSSGVTIQATGAISWRKEAIKYRKNELFIDVIEECNLMMSSKGTVLRNDVEGKIMVKCYLSGQPECKFGLNDKLLLESEAKTKRSAVRRPGSGIEIDDVSFNQVGVPLFW